MGIQARKRLLISQICICFVTLTLGLQAKLIHEIRRITGAKIKLLVRLTEHHTAKTGPFTYIRHDAIKTRP
jgi:protein-S-isoprenylcysteine O-methyltransferase Ste14